MVEITSVTVMKILVSGFKPFLNEKINPSEMLVEKLAQVRSDIATVVLPVEFEKAFVVLREEIEKVSPEFIVMLGQAGGRANVCLEKVALNWNQTVNADESAFVPPTGEIYSGDPLALMTNFPVDVIYQNLKEQSLPVELSFSAGTFVCNNLFYKVLKNYPQIPSVFVHVPLLPEQAQGLSVSKPSMPFETMEKIIGILIAHLRD